MRNETALTKKYKKEKHYGSSYDISFMYRASVQLKRIWGDTGTWCVAGVWHLKKHHAIFIRTPINFTNQFYFQNSKSFGRPTSSHCWVQRLMMTISSIRWHLSASFLFTVESFGHVSFDVICRWKIVLYECLQRAFHICEPKGVTISCREGFV